MIKLRDLKLGKSSLSNVKFKNLEKLCDNIKRDPTFMELHPIIVDEDNTIVGGSQRYRALLSIGMIEVPDTWVRKGDTLTPEANRELMDARQLGFGDLGEVLGLEDDSLEKEWQGMPEFEQDDLMAVQQIIVNFETREDVKAFTKLLNQNITERTRSIWYPEKGRKSLISAVCHEDDKLIEQQEDIL